jgi:hypothetical protein
VQEYSFKFFLELDDALMLTNEDEVVDNIAGTFWRFAFMRNENIPEDHVLEIAKYIRCEQKSILELPREAVLEGRIIWGKPESWKPKRIQFGMDNFYSLKEE